MDISGVTGSFPPFESATPASGTDPAQTREVVQAVKALNATQMFGEENELEFQMDRQAKRMVIQIVNRETQEVVLQIPAEYVLRLSEDLKNSEM
jgi:flagellar protein FlaG